MIRVENARRLYADFCAVDNVSFSIGQGEIVGLLGHNGAGKTTIMKMLTGFLEATTGTIEIDHKSIETHADAIQADIGYLPENLPVYPEMTVSDYLFYCADMRGIDKNEQSQAVKSAIDKTQLEEKALAIIATLSRGYKQRVGVAQALLHNPKLLILDEPTNGLDPHQTQKMRSLILDLAKDATVILSTHIMQEVEAICDRVLILHTGKLVIDKSLQELQRVDALTVSSDAPIAVIEGAIEPFSLSVSKHRQLDGIQHVRIQINEDTDLQKLSANIAASIVGQQHQLFALTPEQQDLEHVFKTIQTKTEVANVA